MLKITEQLSASPRTSLDDFSALIEDVAKGAAEFLEENAPGSNLKRILGGSVHEIGQDRWGVGSYDDLGSSPDDKAPSGTIKAFLKKHNKYRMKWVNGRPPAPYWNYPWAMLPQEGKDELEREREMGNFGGVPGKAPYWHVVDVGYGIPANVTGHHYVAKSTQQIIALNRQRIRDFMGW